MSVIGDFARKAGCPTPLFSATEPIYAAAMSTGHAGDDTASVCAVLEAMAGVKRG
jgi:3-hydroxyisobutyrate dehydrogenase-like beta-hydroxyacid dehydrogenase